MKKFMLVVLGVLVLAGCGETAEEPKVVKQVEETVEVEEKEEEVVEVEEQVLVDNDIVKVTLTGFTSEYDDFYEADSFKVNVTIENKTDSTFEVQTREFSADGIMVDDYVFFSETVSGGKSSKATIEISDFENNDITIEENMEFDLLVADGETWDELVSEPVTIELK